MIDIQIIVTLQNVTITLFYKIMPFRNTLFCSNSTKVLHFFKGINVSSLHFFQLINPKRIIVVKTLQIEFHQSNSKPSSL